MKTSMAMGLLIELLNGKRYTAKQLASKFEISTRSVYRYMDELSEAGVPVSVVQGRSGGWQIDPQFKLASTYFTDAEYSELCFIVDSSNNASPVVQNLANKLKSLGRGKYDVGVLEGDQLVVSTNLSNQLNDKLQMVRRAVVSSLLLNVCYHDAKGQATRRSIEPVSLVLKDGLWYVYAYCRLRKEFRYFKLSRVADVEVTSTRFRPRHHIVDVEEIQTSLIKDKEPEEIILTVSAQSLTKVEEWLGMESVSAIDDYYIARAKVVIDDFVVDKVLALGSGVTVEKPEKLRNAVVEKCNQIAQNYN